MLTGTAPAGLSPAPYFHDVAEGPAGVEAWWILADDGTRLRLGVWPKGPKGTIWMFPGRTEYIEKYGRVAGEFAAAGYGMVAFDWRGQGLADRPKHRRDMGHVVSFDEYRDDVASFRKALDHLGVAGPHYLLAHSMGGAIGLRAVYDGLPFRSVAFSGPMWDIQMAPFLRSISSIVLGLAGTLGLDKSFAPTMGPYAPMEFDDNPLTTDRDQFEYMERQVNTHPDLTLGGPSNRWVRAALEETTELMRKKAPELPAISVVGTRERIVVVDAIEQRMRTWPNGTYLPIEGGEHEVLMESPERRKASIDAIIGHFDAHP